MPTGYLKIKKTNSNSIIIVKKINEILIFFLFSEKTHAIKGMIKTPEKLTKL